MNYEAGHGLRNAMGVRHFFDLLGRTVMNGEVEQNSFVVQTLPSGVYQVEVFNAQYQFVEKLHMVR